MSSILDTKNLIRSIKRRSFIPNDQRTFTDEDFLEMATEEINIGLMDQLIIARGDYLVYHVDVPLVTGTKKYAIPDRAHGNKLRDALIIDSNDSVIIELSQVSLEELYDEESYSNNHNTFYIQNNYLVLNNNNIQDTYSLRFYFYMRPNKLVTLDRAGTVGAFSTGYEIDTINPLSGTITGLSVADPTIITSTAHGLSGGEIIQISGTDSTPGLNGNYTVTYIDANTFSVDEAVTVEGFNGAWSKLVEVYNVPLATVPKNFTTAIKYDLTGAMSPNKIKSFNVTANSLNLTTKIISFRTADIEELTIGDYFTQAEETIVPNVPTEYHPIIAQRVAVACLEAMGDEANKVSAERKLAQMEKSVLRIVTNRVEGAPKKIKNRHGTLNSGRNYKRWGY